MADTQASKFIDSVWTSADDQIASQYRVVISAAPNGTDGKAINGSDQLSSTATNSWIFRLDKSFTIPTQTTSTYETYFNGLKIPRVGAKEDTDKKIKLDFRADQDGKVYTFFKTWVDSGFSPIDAFMGSENDIRKNCNLKIELLKRGVVKTSGFALTEVAKTFTFYHIQPFEINLTELNHESGEPVRVEVQFIYLYYNVA